MATSMRQVNPRRYAVLVPNMLVKLQADRVSLLANSRFFTEERDALAWLADRDEDGGERSAAA